MISTPDSHPANPYSLILYPNLKPQISSKAAFCYFRPTIHDLCRIPLSMNGTRAIDVMGYSLTYTAEDGISGSFDIYTCTSDQLPDTELIVD